MKLSAPSTVLGGFPKWGGRDLVDASLRTQHTRPTARPQPSLPGRAVPAKPREPCAADYGDPGGANASASQRQVCAANGRALAVIWLSKLVPQKQLRAGKLGAP